MTHDVVVVGLDESPMSQAALEWSVEVAARHGGTVEAVHAWRWDVVFGAAVHCAPAESTQAVRQSVDAQIDQARASRPPDAPPVTVRPHTPEGDPASELLAASDSASLLVLGRHGQGRWQRRLVGPTLGSVANQCLSNAKVPVAIIPPDTSTAAPSRVLVGVDGSAPSARALRWAVRHARAVGAPVVAVLAWQLTTIPPPAGPRQDWSVPPLEAWEDEARTMLDETVRGALDAEQAEQVERLLLREPAAAGLLGISRADDLLVLGERGRGGFARLLLGSVSRQCAEHATCPVVVVRPGDRQADDAARQ